MTHPGYLEVEKNIRDEVAKGRTSAGAVARHMVDWAGINGAETLKWMLVETQNDQRRANTQARQTETALRKLLYALHARPMPGYELLSVEDAIANANDLLDQKHALTSKETPNDE